MHSTGVDTALSYFNALVCWAPRDATGAGHSTPQLGAQHARMRRRTCVEGRSILGSGPERKTRRSLYSDHQLLVAVTVRHHNVAKRPDSKRV